MFAKTFLQLTLVVFATATAINAQSVRTLGPPTVLSDYEFAGISSIRELSNKKLLVTDGDDNLLFLFDPASGSATSLGRPGGGPGEFAYARLLVALPNDTTVMPDMSNGRWLILVGSQIATTLPNDNPGVRAAGGGLLGADDRGNVLIQRRLGLRLPTMNGGNVDSLALILVHRGTGKSDTLTRIRSRPVKFPDGVTNRNPLAASAFGVPFETPEQGILFPDGWVAVARVEPYRVDWHTPAGQKITGRPLPYVPVRIDEREIRARNNRITERSAGRLPGLSASARRNTQWPPTGSPFDEGALFAAPDGTLLIRRQLSATDTAYIFDVVDRTGVALTSITIPLNQYIAGFGSESVYIIARDEDGFARIQKHAWPPGR